MRGPELLSESFSDFCNTWGNVSSVVGLVISVLGFGLTIWAVLRAKGAAEQAADAADQAKIKIQKLGTVANFSSAIAAMEDIMRLHRQKDWAGALDRQFELRRILVELKDGGGGLTLDQQTVILGSIEQFKGIERAIEKHTAAATEPKTERLNEVVRNQIVKLHGISITLKNS